MKKTLTGPRGIRLHLDPSEVFPDDPGQGTPAIVEFKGYFGTYNCVTSTGEVDGIPLSREVLDWLDSDRIWEEVEFILDNPPTR